MMSYLSHISTVKRIHILRTDHFFIVRGVIWIRLPVLAGDRQNISRKLTKALELKAFM